MSLRYVKKKADTRAGKDLEPLKTESEPAKAESETSVKTEENVKTEGETEVKTEPENVKAESETKAEAEQIKSDSDINLETNKFNNFEGFKGTIGAGKTISELCQTEGIFKIFAEDLQDVGDVTVELMPDKMKTATRKGTYRGKKNVIYLNMDLIGDNPEQLAKTLMHEVQHAKQTAKVNQLYKKAETQKLTRKERKLIENHEKSLAANREKRDYRKQHKSVLDPILEKVKNLSDKETKAFLKTLTPEERKIYNEYKTLYKKYRNVANEVEARKAGEKAKERVINEKERRKGLASGGLEVGNVRHSGESGGSEGGGGRRTSGETQGAESSTETGIETAAAAAGKSIDYSKPVSNQLSSAETMGDVDSIVNNVLENSEKLNNKSCCFHIYVSELFVKFIQQSVNVERFTPINSNVSCSLNPFVFNFLYFKMQSYLYLAVSDKSGLILSIFIKLALCTCVISDSFLFPVSLECLIWSNMYLNRNI